MVLHPRYMDICDYICIYTYICIYFPPLCVFNYVQVGCYIFNFLVEREYDLAFSEIFIVILITSLLLYFPLSTLPKDAPFPISPI